MGTIESISEKLKCKELLPYCAFVIILMKKCEWYNIYQTSTRNKFSMFILQDLNEQHRVDLKTRACFTGISQQKCV